jgi:hypothetical protein
MREVSSAVNPPNRSASTMTRASVGSASMSAQSEGGTEPTNARSEAARCSKLPAEFCPASKTTVISAAAGVPVCSVRAV